MTPQDWIREAREVCEKATPGDYVVERVGFDDGEFAYEVNDKHHLVSFGENNFESPMKAKFNAEFYAYARTALPKALDALDSAIIGLAYTPCPDSCYAYDPCWACATLARISAILSPEGKGEG